MASGGPPDVKRRRAGFGLQADDAWDAEATWDGAAPFGDLGTNWQNDLTLQPETVAPRHAGPAVPTIVRRSSKHWVAPAAELPPEDATDEAPAMTEEAGPLHEDLTATEESALERGLTEEADYEMPPETASHDTHPTDAEPGFARHEAQHEPEERQSHGAEALDGVFDLPTSAFAPLSRRRSADEGVGEALITAALWMMASSIAMFLAVLAWSVLR